MGLLDGIAFERLRGDLSTDDNAARRYVEHDTTAQETFGKSPEGWLTLAEMRKELDIPSAKDTYISTYTGRFHMFAPTPDQVRIVDIAHGLANICRYTGAGAVRYSVAEHSVHIYRWLTAMGYPPRIRLAGLLHDSPEALSGFGDVARPAKKHAPIIKETEDNIWRLAIAPAFGLDAEMPAAVHEADNRICADEMEQNMHEVDPTVGPSLGIKLEYWEPIRAEAEFLRAFHAVRFRQNMRAHEAYRPSRPEDGFVEDGMVPVARYGT